MTQLLLGFFLGGMFGAIAIALLIGGDDRDE